MLKSIFDVSVLYVHIDFGTTREIDFGFDIEVCLLNFYAIKLTCQIMNELDGMIVSCVQYIESIFESGDHFVFVSSSSASSFYLFAHSFGKTLQFY